MKIWARIRALVRRKQLEKDLDEELAFHLAMREYKNYRDHNHVFSGLLAYEPFLEATLAGESPKQLMGAAASCNYFAVLGGRPALGRVFVDADCSAPGATAVVVLSDDLWRSRFG